MKNLFLTLCLSLFIISCTNEHFFGDEEIFGLASVVNLSTDTTTVILNDYFMDVNVIQKISVDSSLSFALSADKKILKIWANAKEAPFLSNLNIQTNKGIYAILVKKNLNELVTFKYTDPTNTVKRVAIRGDMNSWSNTADTFANDNGTWTLTKLMEPGVYQYLMNVNGKDQLDSNATDKTSNGNGGYNSILKVALYNSNVPKLNTFSVKEGLIEILSDGADKLIAYWQNQSIEIKDNKITIPKAAAKMNRSYVRVYSFNKFGTSNDLLIPIENGKVITSAANITRLDKEGNIYYFMMVDRFLDGNKDNTQKVIADSLADRANYYGGDLAGITQKIKDGYFSSVGINTIWVSPLNQNPEGAYHEYIVPQRKYSGYHGYWVVSISNVDHRLGTEAELKELVAEAHKNKINVILDFVSNHIHMENPIYQQHKDEWFNSIYLPDGTKNLRRWNEYDLTTWFDEFLADIDYSKEAPLQMFTDSAVGWIKRFDLDGFRHDAVKHVPQIFWRTLTYKLKKEIEIPQQKHLIQIGETFGSRSLMNSYIGSGQLDAQFDFNVYFDARSAFIEDKVSFDKAKDAVNASLNYFGYHHLMGNITGNHDITRFMAYASKGMSFSDNDRETGWQRDLKIVDTLGYRKLQMMTAFIMTIPGTPVIYYGDEIGMTGANDPDNRRPMIFDTLSHFQIETKDIASKLCALRKSEMSLMYGTYQDLQCNEAVYCYLRRYFNEVSVIVFNKSDMPQTVDLNVKQAQAATHFGSTATFANNQLNVTIPAHSFDIITLKY